MTGEAQGNGKDSGGAVVELRVPMLTVTFDPRTCSVEISGNAPCTYFAKVMLLMALDGVEQRLQIERAPVIERVSGTVPIHRGG